MDDVVDRASAERAQTTRHASLEGHAARDERMLKALFDQSATGFAILDRDFKYVRVNAAFAQQFGDVASQFTGRGYTDAAGDCSETLRGLTEVARTKKAIRVAARPEFWAVNSTVANVDWMVEPLLDQDGELEWLVLSSIDVTEQKRTELELRQRESLYRAVFTAMDEGVVCQSATGEITVANPAAARITGRSEREMRGRTSDDPWWQAVHEDGSPFPGHEHPSIVTLRTGIAQSNVVMGIRGPDGTKRWLSINSQLLPPEALAQTVVTTFRDITEQRAAQKRLRESEERLRLILANSPDTIVYSDRNLRVTELFNPRAPLLAGAMIGKTERDYLPPDEAERFLTLREYVLTTGNSTCEELSVSLGGSVHWYDASFHPLRNDRGEVAGVVTYRRDITERKRAEEGQQRLNRALRLMSKCSKLLVHADDESRFLRAICQLIVTDGGYLAASVRDPYTNDVLCRVERSEREPADPDQVGARSKPGSEGSSKAPAIHPGRAPELVSERALPSPAGSYIDIPLTSGDRDHSGLTNHSADADAGSDDRISGDHGVLTIYSIDANAFSRDEVALLDELGRDVAYGIRTLRMGLNHRAAEEKLAFLAYHDPLTKLPNRRLLRERFERAAANADRAGDRVAVLFLDLDSFKEINDGLGHDVGDKLLVRIAERLQKNVRLTDTVSREGGDEFAVLLAGIPDVHAMARIAQTLLGAIAEPFDIDLNTLTTSLSMGISVYPDDGRDFDRLRNQADTALHHAKESGRNAYRFFSNQMSADSLARTEMQLQLREALKRGEFYLCYQPQICIRDNRITAVEALLRWQRSDLDTLLPDRFIPIAERSGLIIPIGDWVLNEACRQAAAWREAGLADLIVAVNLSALQIRRGNLASVVTLALERSRLPASSLELELTESILLQDTELTISTLQALHTIGVRFAIDDFGTGYSSLSYLKRLAVSKLKIDRLFISNLTEDAGDAAIVKAIIQLGHTMQLEVVAEGVETADQLVFLKDSGCDQAQGLLFSMPVSAGDVPRLFTA
jgi:diguanylate cyclase (GGDEF)-like protein/PAS domain S-box-containing protein